MNVLGEETMGLFPETLGITSQARINRRTPIRPQTCKRDRFLCVADPKWNRRDQRERRERPGVELAKEIEPRSFGRAAHPLRRREPRSELQVWVTRAFQRTRCRVRAAHAAAFGDRMFMVAGRLTVGAEHHQDFCPPWRPLTMPPSTRGFVATLVGLLSSGERGTERTASRFCFGSRAHRLPLIGAA